MTDYEPLEPTLQNILDQKSLRWIFVGGKGGVGKTTSSCSLAIQLAKVRESVLLISTDPAHNLSDAFGQKFGKDPRKIEGYSNLSAMEIDPDAGMQEMIQGSNNDMISNTMQDLTLAIPGIDELVSFGEILKQVKSTSYSVIVFDTAPTGHTLRFLNMPTAIESAMEKLTSRFAPILGSLMGGEQGDAFSKMNSLRKDIAEVNAQFKDADLTTFVCVCIAEFLSLYETERMVQELTSFHIDTHNIIVNQLLHPEQGSTCEQCNARNKIQQKYLEQILDLYEDFHIVQMPQLTSEVRGKAALDSFSEMLIHPAWKN